MAQVHTYKYTYTYTYSTFHNSVISGFFSNFFFWPLMVTSNTSFVVFASFSKGNAAGIVVAVVEYCGKPTMNCTYHRPGSGKEKVP